MLTAGSAAAAPHRQRTVRPVEEIERRRRRAAYRRECIAELKDCAGGARRPEPGHRSAGQRMSSASARDFVAACGEILTAMPITVASGSASARSRAHASARAISSRGVAPFVARDATRAERPGLLRA